MNVISLTTCLRQCERFATTFNIDGQAIAYEFASPSRAFRISESMRALLACFPGHGLTAVGDAIAAYCRCKDVVPTSPLTDELLEAVRLLGKIGILEEGESSAGPYTSEMTAAYLNSRPVPDAVCNQLIRDGKITANTKVLDVCSGAGSVANALAAASDRVIGIDRNPAFIDIACAQSNIAGSKATYRRECANKLIFAGLRADIVVMCQSFHWLDPMWITRGLNVTLENGGLLFLIETKAVVSKRHPFRKLFGYGYSSERQAMKACTQHYKRYIGLFRALEKPAMSLVPTNAQVYRQRKIFDLEFAKAYFFQQQLDDIEQLSGDQWNKLDLLLQALTTPLLTGHLYWLVLAFRKVGASDRPKMPVHLPQVPIEIPEAVPRTAH